jgi:predicted  nucleic acid-binding Zn-ribbon protein
MLHPELETLLELQDLHTLRRDILSPEYAATGMSVDPQEYARQLDLRIAEREAHLSPRVRSVYKRIASRHARVVAPVLDGVCYGCFVHVPTATERDKERNTHIRNCESCGRFIYYTD